MSTNQQQSTGTGKTDQQINEGQQGQQDQQRTQQDTDQQGMKDQQAGKEPMPG